MAANEGIGDIQIKIFDFPNPMAAYALSPDAQIIRKVSLPKAAIRHDNNSSLEI
jgi:hypothetical protein